MTHVIIAKNAHAKQWRDYCSKHSSHHCFNWAWREVIAKSFGHQPIYLIAQDNNSNICGCLPLFKVKSALFGKSYISIPYLNAGGVVASSNDALNALVDKACEIAREDSAKYLELRHVAALPGDFQNLTCRKHKISMLLALEDVDCTFSGFSSKLRSQIRKAEKNGLSAKSSVKGDFEQKLIDDFYKVFSENMRDLGTPVYPKKLFVNTIRNLDSARVHVVYLEDNPIAASITTASKTSAEVPWASSLRKYNKLSSNMLLYWQMIKTSCEDGYKQFDFGRSSPDSATFRFKKQWGAKPVELHWYYDSQLGNVPDVSPNSGGFSLLVRCWQKLPLKIANLLGPIITPHLP